MILALLLMSLAVWRLSNMLSDTDQTGPFDILHRIRLKTGMYYDEWSNPAYKHGSIADMLSCVFCNSVWLGIVFTILFICNREVTIIVSLPFALSAITILIEDWRENGNKT